MTIKIEQLFSKGIIDIDDSFFSNHSIDVNAWALELQKCFFNENNSEIKEVNNDGIKIKTINGDFLLENSPETAKAYKAVFQEFSPLFQTGLFEIENKKIAYSSNLITKGDSFRHHFDRHDFTAVIYLSDAPEFPLVMYPLVRPHGILKSLIKGNLMRYMWFKYVTCFKKKHVIFPSVGKAVVFLGTENLHGVIPVQNTDNDSFRISVQFGFNFTDRIVSEEYYGNP